VSSETEMHQGFKYTNNDNDEEFYEPFGNIHIHLNLINFFGKINDFNTRVGSKIK